MTAFTVWKFEEPDGAARAEASLEAAAADKLVTIVDHAVLSWPEGDDRPTLHHEYDGPKRGAAWGALWGVLGGALFMVPLGGAVLGAGLGALAKITDGTGITKDELEKIRTEVTPGTSALLMVTEDADLDRLGERWRGVDSTLLTTNLTDAERAKLMETFGGS